MKKKKLFNFLKKTSYPPSPKFKRCPSMILNIFLNNLKILNYVNNKINEILLNFIVNVEAIHQPVKEYYQLY